MADLAKFPYLQNTGTTWDQQRKQEEHEKFDITIGDESGRSTRWVTNARHFVRSRLFTCSRESAQSVHLFPSCSVLVAKWRTRSLPRSGFSASTCAIESIGLIPGSCFQNLGADVALLATPLPWTGVDVRSTMRVKARPRPG